MLHRIQFSLRALLIAACLVGPVVLLGRWLFNLSYMGMTALAIAILVSAAVLTPQAVLLKIVTRSRDD